MKELKRKKVAKMQIAISYFKQLKEFCVLKNKIEVLKDQIKAYKGVFVDACANVKRLDEAMSKYLHETAQEVTVETCNLEKIKSN